MKRKSSSAMKLQPNFDKTRKPYRKLNETLISFGKLDLFPKETSLNSSENPIKDRFSLKIHNFFEFLKQNERTKYSISKENLFRPQIPSQNPSNFSLWDFKKIRDFSKKSRNFKDVALSPIPQKDDFSLNFSSIITPFSSNKKKDFEKNSQEKALFEKELSSLKLELELSKEEILKKSSKILEKSSEIELLHQKTSETWKKLEEFELIQKKNELLMDYLKEKELKLLSLQSRVSELQNELFSAENYRTILHCQIQELKGNLRIFCRIKPLNDLNSSIITLPELKNYHLLELKNPNSSKSSYYFDRIFDFSSNQKDIFQEIAPFVQSSIDGEQVSILAYGQTGSGKTFTLEGPGLYEDEDIQGEMRGIMPRAVEFIFQEKKRMEIGGRYMKFLLSILEIYNENLADLLNSENKPNIIQIGSKVLLKNYTSIEISDMKQLLNLIRKANKARVTDKTHYNERSSRSHCIYRINISFNGEKDKEGVLNIVDLAGSERSSIDELSNEKDKEKMKKIQNEANFINKSLTTLGRIVRIISEKQPLANIPYRESKLTRLLQDCLGGNGKSLMFINVCANQENYYQTKESLKFSAKANF